jgi:hypothetical protein
MEAISNGVEDYLIDGLSFKLPPGSSYITDRRNTTYWASGSNIYNPDTGTKLLKFYLAGDDGNWLDPSTVRIQFTLKNNSASGHYLRPLSEPYSFFRRVRILAGGVLVEDILDYNRCQEMMYSFMNHNVRDNNDIESWGYRYDSLLTNNNYTTDTLPGIASGSSLVVSFKLLSGLLSQNKLIPIKFCPWTIELELVSGKEDVIVSPGANIVFTADNTGNVWEINNPQLKCDICTLDNSLNNSYIEHLLAGKALPIKYSTFINQQSSISGSNIAVQVARAVSRLQKAFITFYKTGGSAVVDKTALKFYHPMAGTLDITKDLEFQLQLGSKLYPEYPCKSISECFYILRKTLNLPEFHQHSIGITFKDFIDHKFIFTTNFEKVPESSWTGTNTKAGQLLIVKVKANDSSLTDIASTMFITLVSEQILEVRDVGCTVYD